MDITSIKSSSTCDATHTSSVSAKMKRLQIEESLLIQSINKCVVERSNAGEWNSEATCLSNSQFKDYVSKIKKSYKEIKLLFEDIKTRTSSQEMLKTLDMDDIKNSTLELENRIKSFKLYLQSVIANLKSAEQLLNQTLNENASLNNKVKKQPRIQTAKYNEIVPSPVKTMMTSPFKCTEVQQFQEFMMSSANRYGGWNEYYHNIFVSHWQKHFGFQMTFDETDNTVEKNPAFQLFLHELFSKLQGVREEEIISHVKWYSKYIYLKDRQQQAIDKWRDNRKVMKSANTQQPNRDSNKRNKSNGRKSVVNNIDLNNAVSDTLNNVRDLGQHSPEPQFTRKCYSEEIKRVELDIDQSLPHFQKSTKQWCNKVISKDDRVETSMNNLENIKKLCVPEWRVGL